MDEKIKLLVSTLGENRLKKDENLKYHTYLKRDGLADFFYIVTTQQELIDVLNSVFGLKIPFLVFGNGTKLVFKNNRLKSLVIKNRTGSIKIGGIKGKVGQTGIGIEEALIEVDSGVSFDRLNEFLKEQKLQILDSYSAGQSTIGGALFLDSIIQNSAQKIKIWQKGKISDIKTDELTREMIILSVVLRIKARI